MDDPRTKSAIYTEVIMSSDGRKQVIHSHQDSASLMEALFDPFIDQQSKCNSVPWRKRNLPRSIFEQPNKVAPYQVYHGHSKSTGIIKTSRPVHVKHSHHSSFELSVSKASISQQTQCSFNSNNNNNNNNNVISISTNSYDFQNQLKETKKYQGSSTFLHKKENEHFQQKQVDHSRSRSLPATLQVNPYSFTQEKFQLNNKQSYSISNNLCGRNTNKMNYLKGENNSMSFDYIPGRVELPSQCVDIKFQQALPQQTEHHLYATTRKHDGEFRTKAQVYDSCPASLRDANYSYNQSEQIHDQESGPGFDSSSSVLMSLLREKRQLSQQISEQRPPQPIPLHPQTTAPPLLLHGKEASSDSGLGMGGLSLSCNSFAVSQPPPPSSGVSDAADNAINFRLSSTLSQTHQSHSGGPPYSLVENPHFRNQPPPQGGLGHHPQSIATPQAAFDVAPQSLHRGNAPHVDPMEELDWLNEF